MAGAICVKKHRSFPVCIEHTRDGRIVRIRRVNSADGAVFLRRRGPNPEGPEMSKITRYKRLPALLTAITLLATLSAHASLVAGAVALRRKRS